MKHLYYEIRVWLHRVKKKLCKKKDKSRFIY